MVGAFTYEPWLNQLTERRLVLERRQTAAFLNEPVVDLGLLVRSSGGKLADDRRIGIFALPPRSCQRRSHSVSEADSH
jgi:hypothetical protein